MREGRAAFDQSIEMGCVDIRVSEASDNLVAHVVGKNEKDVGSRRVRRVGRGRAVAIEQECASGKDGEAWRKTVGKPA